MSDKKGVSMAKMAHLMDLKVFTENIDLKQHKTYVADVNRPALQIAGYYDHFDNARIQLIGTVEQTYLDKQTQEKKIEIYNQLLSYKIPCVIFCRDFKPDEDFLKAAEKNDIPVMGTNRNTSAFMAELIGVLNEQLAPSVTLHGVLVDVYGEGLLITGESGIGKSEAALELIKRGHRLVTDDVVEIRKINEHTLIGTSPDITRYFIELRGIGILDVKTLFGVECVKEKQSIDLVINLQTYKEDFQYDRLGMEDEYTDILGMQVVSHNLPIRPGRNLAVICEAAAVNHRQKKMGYNAAKELYRRVQANMTRFSDEDEEE
ncbi:MAG: HPr(Ser) kinase/phosphatase [Lachnospiraceae bacterium]|nr:HPr(Ser) kinase/phosphatase [Lachnospiraceae bacterium]